MEYAIEMGSGGMIHIPSFMTVGSGIQTLLGGIFMQTHTQQGDPTSLDI
jgi:hypothetical protein